MIIINCLDCGKLILPRYIEKLCPDCELIQKEKADTIKEYMHHNPRATRMDVYLETGISLRIIDRISNS